MRRLPALIILLPLTLTPHPMPADIPATHATAPNAAAQRSIVIATFNLGNALDTLDDPYTEDEKTRPKPEADLQRIAATLKTIDADVVIVQEIENEHYLESLNEKLLQGCRYRFVAVQPTNDPRGISIGLLSRHPIQALTSYRHRFISNPDHPQKQWRFARDLLHAELHVNGRPLHVFGVHLKSMRTSDETDPEGRAQRLAEAREIRTILERFATDHPETPFVLAGDFNSDPKTKLADGAPDTALTHLLSAPSNTGKFLLTDAHQALPRPVRISLPGHGNYADKVVDYVLASPGLKTSKPRVWDQENSGSDHRPVWVSVDVP